MIREKESLLYFLLIEFIAELTAQDKCACDECLGGYINQFLGREVPND